MKNRLSLLKKKTEQTKDFYYTKVFEKAQIKLQYILL